MDLRVLQEVRYGGERHSAGSVLRDVPITTGRRMLLGGDVEHYTPGAPEPDTAEGPRLETLKVADLRTLAKELGVPSDGKREDLLELIQAELDRLGAAESPADSGDQE